MSYLILGMLDLINEMTRHEFCVSTALITMYRQPTGLIRFLAAGRNDFGTPEEEPVTENATLHTVQSQNLTAPRRIVDPQDPDSAILYERKGKVMSSVDFLSTVLYAVATAAQDDNGEYCEDLAGFNEQRSVVYRIRGLEHTVSGYLLTYGIVRTGLKLLSKAVYRERTSGEMHISFEYRGDVLGHGHIDLSDFAHGTER